MISRGDSGPPQVLEVRPRPSALLAALLAEWVPIFFLKKLIFQLIFKMLCYYLHVVRVVQGLTTLSELALDLKALELSLP